MKTYPTDSNSDNYDFLPSLGTYPQLIIMSLAGTFIVKLVVETKTICSRANIVIYTKKVVVKDINVLPCHEQIFTFLRH